MSFCFLVWFTLFNIESLLPESYWEFSPIYLNFLWAGLVLWYINKVEVAMGEKDSIQPNTREEVFRYTLTLLSLLENPPGDFPDSLREDLTKGFVSIFRHVRYT